MLHACAGETGRDKPWTLSTPCLYEHRDELPNGYSGTHLTINQTIKLLADPKEDVTEEPELQPYNNDP